jgi:hypothetical protein
MEIFGFHAKTYPQNAHARGVCEEPPEGVCSFLPQGSCAISQLLVVYQGHSRMLRSDVVDHRGRSTLP